MKYQFKIEDYDGLQAGWAELEQAGHKGCQCEKCKKQFNEHDPMEMAPRCHPGDTIVAYWDGWLYIRCAACNRPIVKIPVSRSLL